jgi:Asp-tRNA(Asn)/Glu-tRNA(Gln) amidotransferase A subunit family amidase
MRAKSRPTVSARQASAVETVRDALDRIAAAKALNAVVTVSTDAHLQKRP